MKLNLTNRRTLLESLPDTYIAGVEVGVRTGWYLRYILEYTSMKEVYGVDPWEQNPQLMKRWDEAYESAVKLTKPYGDRVKLLRGWSPEITSEFHDDYFNFIYIDAEHTYDAVKKDVNSWWTKLKKGGIMAGHDYGWETVKKAVDEFVEEKNVNLYMTGIVGNSISSRTGDIDEFDGNQPSWVIIKE